MLATSPPRIFKIDLSKRVSELARHLATTDFLIHMIQRETVWICLPLRHQWLNMLTTLPPMIFKNEFSKLVSLMARHLTTNEFQIHVHQRESVWMCSPPRHQWFFMNDISKLVSGMARHLATKEFWIHILQREPVWICSPPCHQGFINNHFPKLVLGLSHYLATIELLKTYCSKRACLGFLTTSDFTA